LPKENQILSDDDPNKFIAKMGAEAVHMLLSRIDLDAKFLINYAMLQPLKPHNNVKQKL
jgi:hypothetical protein